MIILGNVIIKDDLLEEEESTVSKVFAAASVLNEGSLESMVKKVTAQAQDVRKELEKAIRIFGGKYQALMT